MGARRGGCRGGAGRADAGPRRRQQQRFGVVHGAPAWLPTRLGPAGSPRRELSRVILCQATADAAKHAWLQGVAASGAAGRSRQQHRGAQRAHIHGQKVDPNDRLAAGVACSSASWLLPAPAQSRLRAAR